MVWPIFLYDSGTSLLRSPSILGQSDLNSEVTALAGLKSYNTFVLDGYGNNLGLSRSYHNGEVTIKQGLAVYCCQFW